MVTKEEFFPYPLIALLIGVGLGSGGAAKDLFFFLIFLALLILLVALWHKSVRVLSIALVMLFVALGGIRYVYWRDTPLDPIVLENINKTVTLEGVVIDEPDVREGGTQLTIRIRTLDGSVVSPEIDSRVLIFASRYPEYEYGAVLRIKGKIARPKKFSADGGNVFDYPMYLASKGISYQISFPNVTKIGDGEGNALLDSLYRTKHYFAEQLALYFPEPEGALLGGLLLGGKQSLGKEWQETFRTAGIIHIVVLSGYNMTVVSDWLVKSFRFLGFYGSQAVGAVGIVLFALMTGAGATVVRAAIMALLAVIARTTGRTYAMSRALLFAGACMVLENPSILAYDPSFQLSFLASLGLILVSPIIEERTRIFAKWETLREVFVSTVATQVMVLPLLLYQTGVFSVVSLFSNLLVLPVIPFTMFFGFLAGVVAIVFSPLAPTVAVIAHILLAWILLVANTMAHIPFARITVAFSSGSVVCTYVLLAVYLWYQRRITKGEPLPLSPQSPHLNTVVDKKE